MTDSEPRAYWERRLETRYRLEGVGFQGLGESYNRWLYRVRRAVFHRIVGTIPIVLRETDVLDLGSGTGFYIERWLSLGVRSVTGIDFTDVAVRNLRERFPGATFHRLDVGDDVINVLGRERFDVVSAFDVLFHIVDDVRYEKAMHTIAASMRPGGWFLFSDNFLHDETRRTPVQVSRSLVEIERVVRASGFRVVKRVPMFVLMNAPVDTGPAWIEAFWTRTRTVLKRRKRAGSMVGLALYPVERLLTRLVRESRTTEVMVCQKEP